MQTTCTRCNEAKSLNDVKFVNDYYSDNYSFQVICSACDKKSKR